MTLCFDHAIAGVLAISVSVCVVSLVLPASGVAAEPVTESLWPDSASTITVHRPPRGKANGTAVVICPGGGYGALMMSYEGHDIARWLNRYGVVGIVLKYRIRPHRHPLPMRDGQRAMRLVRVRAADWGIMTNRIGMMGFSAGGHLASTVGTHFDDGNAQAEDPVERVGCRPDFLLLVYPVISVGERGHVGCRNNLLGPAPGAEDMAQLANEQHVTPETPATFLAHAKTDKVVPVEHSAMFHAALRRHGVASEFFELPTGRHGLGCGKGKEWIAWQERCLAWLRSRGLIAAE